RGLGPSSKWPRPGGRARICRQPMSTRVEQHRLEGENHVSTGVLPPSAAVQEAVSDAYERYRENTSGRLSNVYPSLAAARPDLFGICIAGTSGHLYAAGDAEREFAIMSVAKPFVFALVCAAVGPARARELLGVNGTGLPFNSLEAIERSADGRTNPM